MAELHTGGVQASHQAALDQGRFLIQHCKACGRHVYFPREICPHCGGESLDLVAPSGLGTVYSVTTMRRKAEAGGDYNVSLIDLDEGVRLMSRVERVAPDAVKIGQRVKARVQVQDGRGLVLFDAVDAAAPRGPV
ncbi:MAG: OB-fold domain-containing protein [Rhodoferax sp.]